jgi:Zn-dependent protease with chaperone function
MDFFSAQDDARRRTRLLIGLFLLSLTCLLMMANALLYFFLDTSTQPIFYVGVSVAILLIVLLSSVFKSISLRQGGEAVAEMLNARLLVAPSTPGEHRLLNVVEEMAIASGTPVPPVYVMEETAINAFAAGHSINDAVLGITRGAIDKLSRDEIQGVIAHEFSHILHGDMRLNLRLIAWLHGIMVVGIMGHFILRAASTSRRSNNNNIGIVVFGLGLIVLGASGNFFGGLIKAAVSRQREYLADASAVQYTRNPQGIAGALKRIAVDTSSPVLANQATSQISHALFSEGVHLRFSSLMATHPPLDKRIRVLDPHWNGEYQAYTPQNSDNSVPDVAAKRPALVPLALALAVARAGAPDEVDVSEAQMIRDSLPAACANSARNPLSAAAVICLLLMQEELLRLTSEQRGEASMQQFLSLRVPTGTANSLEAEMIRVLPDIIALAPSHRLALVNICLGTLRQLSLEQYTRYRSILSSIVDSDPSPDLGSWLLFQLTTHHLDKVKGLKPNVLLSPQIKLTQSTQLLEIFFSVLSHCGHRSKEHAESAFRAAAKTINMPELNFRPSDSLGLEQFQQATIKLLKLVEIDKRRLLDAMTACVYHDQKLTVVENELMRMTSEMIDWPLPAKIIR